MQASSTKNARCGCALSPSGRGAWDTDTEDVTWSGHVVSWTQKLLCAQLMRCLGRRGCQFLSPCEARVADMIGPCDLLQCNVSESSKTSPRDIWGSDFVDASCFQTDGISLRDVWDTDMVFGVVSAARERRKRATQESSGRYRLTYPAIYILEKRLAVPLPRYTYPLLNVARTNQYSRPALG
eukprot:1029253-Rhodomonas_salina.1